MTNKMNETDFEMDEMKTTRQVYSKKGFAQKY